MDTTASADAAPEPIDTTGDQDLEERWNAAIDRIVRAKAAYGEARQGLIDAEIARGPAHLASDEALAAVDAARHAVETARSEVAAASGAVKEGRI